MTVKDLKQLLAGIPDDLMVIIPTSMEFDGVWASPCFEDTGVIELGLEDLSEEDIKERQLLNQPIATEKSFCIVPCGYFAEHDPHEVSPELN